MADGAALVAGLRALLGPDGCLADPAARRVYARDASHLELGRPLAVALPRTHAQAAAVVALCARHGVPFTARGAGSGLSGGALPQEGAVVVSGARLLELEGADDPARPWVRAGAGVPNASLDRALARRGGAFAPDPSSQEVSTLGGNIAENAGGPHCLKVGTTVRHVRALRWIDPQGNTWDSRGDGWDLTPLLVGSEGTLGLITAAELTVTPREPDHATLLVYLSSLEAAADGVLTLLGDGLLPAALEAVDGAMLQLVEEAFAFGFRTDAAAALIVEFSGTDAAVRRDADRAAALLRAAGAEVIPARDEAERLALWRCRKRAFGAVGRLSPNYVTMDVAVPVGRLPAMVRAVGEAGRAHGVRIATALHAGDGNLHPGVMYDARDPGSTARAHAAADAIMAAALALDGTVTGEHGVGVEKLHVVARQLHPVALDLMRGIKRALDPRGLCNPGKLLPPGPGLAASPPAPEGVTVDRASLHAAAPAHVTLGELRAAAAGAGLDVPCADGADTLPLSDALARDRTLRDAVLQIHAETLDGRAYHAGRPVVKNVAGLDLPRLVSAAGGALGPVRAVGVGLRPRGVPSEPNAPEPPALGPEPGAVFQRIRAAFAGEDLA
ncbi:MAG TPA: FAD-linked oxidase C-terminal domain-containing protein [Candidatus Krumholzibacteria bacterium]|nr:FAD-linked oxidase C-terminal domain-containing protein [Candidatus Krumholzibacteria bacterium]HRX51164.1 FAD-linked oxidase C-terminal domain-containing protein [Candidatus Krumholzibacteria bacterium]